MRKLVMLGDAARSRLEHCFLADPRVHNEVALVLGAIGDERTAALLIDCYPEDGADPRAFWKDARARQVVCLSFALSHLTAESIGRSREGANGSSANRDLWRRWWAQTRDTFKVPAEKPNASWVPHYPNLSDGWAKWARDRFAKERDDEGR
jgi:hypothetical protein